jgi:hypothetical protein
MVESEHLVADTSLVPQGDIAKTGPHLRSELQHLMSRVCPDDLSSVEISGLLAILAVAYARVIGEPIGQPRLRVVQTAGERAAPTLDQ